MTGRFKKKDLFLHFLTMYYMYVSNEIAENTIFALHESREQIPIFFRRNSGSYEKRYRFEIFVHLGQYKRSLVPFT